MKRVLIALVAIAFTIGCNKEPITDTPSDFAITLFREFSNGERLVAIEKPVQGDRDEGPNVYFTVDGSRLTLRIGRNARPDTKLGANIVFLNQTDPKKIVGTYEFPRDRDKADIELFEYTTNGFTRTSIPSQGTLTVSYDPRSNTYNGIVEQLSYHIPFRADYVYQVITMRFDGARFR